MLTFKTNVPVEHRNEFGTGRTGGRCHGTITIAANNRTGKIDVLCGRCHSLLQADVTAEEIAEEEDVAEIRKELLAANPPEFDPTAPLKGTNPPVPDPSAPALAIASQGASRPAGQEPALAETKAE